ncbi:MAG: DEAD/DEAH box helicase [Chloroflexi bacterium]|nr:DEAD/DEAH box helicase [Chloroflexota bacterium]
MSSLLKMNSLHKGTAKLHAWLLDRFALEPSTMVDASDNNQISASDTRAIENVTLQVGEQYPIDLSNIQIPGSRKGLTDYKDIGVLRLGLLNLDEFDDEFRSRFTYTKRDWGKAINDFRQDIIEYFEPITATSTAGAIYHSQDRSRYSENQLYPNMREYCKHGLDRRLCYLCRQERENSKYKPASTESISRFGFLKPYLYPPIDQSLPSTTLFIHGLYPYPYQWDGIRFLVHHEQALLADEMGLGKTIQAIVALRSRFRQAKSKRVLIVCPKSLLGTWKRELGLWAPELSVQTISGPVDERLHMWQSDVHVFLCSYETLRQDVGYVQSHPNWIDSIILDEVQRVKNPETLAHHAVLRVAAGCRWGLSGTPLENKIEDVEAVFGALGLRLVINDRYSWNTKEIREVISPVILRRRIADVEKQLPPKQAQEIWLELNPRQRATYLAEENSGVSSLQRPGATRIHVLALITKLKQICNYDPISNSSCKLDYLTEALDEVIELGQKALVFSHYPNVTLRAIQSKLTRYQPSIFDGSLTSDERDRIIYAFQNNATPKVLLMSVQAGGLGITLTRANHVFHYDHWWNPAVAKQAEGRAHRIGQSKTVFVHHLYVSNTIEERIYDLLVKKQNLFDAVIDSLSTDTIVGKLSDDDLFGLFGLQAPVTEKRTRKP